MTIQYRFALLSSLALLLVAEPAFSDDAPTAPLAVSRPHPALRFARRDAERAAQQAKLASEKAVATAQQSAVVEKAASDAAAEKVAAEKNVAQSADLIKQIEALLAAVEKAAQSADAAGKSAVANAPGDAALQQATKSAIESASMLLAVSRKTLEERRAALKTAEATKVAAEKKAQEAATAAKPQAEARVAAEKGAVEAAAAAKSAGDRVIAFEAAPPKLNPAQIRLVSTFKHNSPLMSCGIDPAGDFVFAGAQDNSIQRWDLATGSQAALQGHKSWVARLAFPGAGSPLVSGAYEGKLTWWDALAATPSSARTIDAHKGFIRAVAVSPDGKLLATGGDDRVVRVWSAADGTLAGEMKGHENHVYGIGFHPDGKNIISGDLMGVVKQWEVGTWKHVRDFDAGALHKFDDTFKAHCGGIRAVAFSPDGTRLAVGGISEVTNAFAGIGKPAVLLFDWADGKRLQVFNPAGSVNGSVWGLNFDPNGEFVVAAGGGGGGGWLWMWKLDQPKAVVDFKLPQAAYDMAFHPDGLRVAVALYDSTVRLYDLGPQPSVAAPDAKTTAAAK